MMDREVKLLEGSPEGRVLRCLGFFGHFLHVHAGGRSGKQHILACLLCHDGHLTQRELQEQFPISSAALSEVLAKLESEGLIVRTRSAQDKRQLDIVLTSTGVFKATRIVKERLDFERASLEALNAGERAQLADLLEKVATSWKEKEGKKATE